MYKKTTTYSVNGSVTSSYKVKIVLGQVKCILERSTKWLEFLPCVSNTWTTYAGMVWFRFKPNIGTWQLSQKMLLIHAQVTHKYWCFSVWIFDTHDREELVCLFVSIDSFFLFSFCNRVSHCVTSIIIVLEVEISQFELLPFLIDFVLLKFSLQTINIFFSLCI